MAEVIQHRSDARLVFPGTRHPNVEAVPDMPMRRRAVQLAKELDLVGRQVFFGDWVDYAEWPNYLLEADVGVSLHFDTLETRLAFRSRVLHYVWAELPVVATRGDAAGEMVAQHGLGQVVDFGDVEGVATAILELLQVVPETWRARFAMIRAELAWEQVAGPLVAFCKKPHRAADERGVTSTTGDLASELEGRLRHQEDELERLRALVDGYEQGRLIRLMSWLHNIRQQAGV
jgi:hypothetical protein